MKKKIIYSLTPLLLTISHLSSLSKQHTPASAYTLQASLCAVIALFSKQHNPQQHIPMDIQKIIINYCISQQRRPFSDYKESRKMNNGTYKQRLIQCLSPQHLHVIDASTLKKIDFFIYNNPTGILYIHHADNLIINLNRVCINTVIVNGGTLKGINITNANISTINMGHKLTNIESTQDPLQKDKKNLIEVYGENKRVHLKGSIHFNKLTLGQLYLHIKGEPNEESEYFIYWFIKNTCFKNTIHLKGDAKYIITTDSYLSINNTPSIQLFSLTTDHIEKQSSLCGFFMQSYDKEHKNSCCTGFWCFCICMPLHCCCLIAKEKQYKQLLENYYINNCCCCIKTNHNNITQLQNHLSDNQSTL